MRAPSSGATSWGFCGLRIRAPVLVLVIVIDLSIISETSPAMRLRTIIVCAGLKDARIVDYDYEHEHEGVALKLDTP
ncbi:MAG: hypothetical protein FJY92_02600 [Candidatus Hydrogenedentes bacterium]|nr:hypothetical protein [Candidatus Hydrogenedentota bacterium]